MPEHLPPLGASDHDILKFYISFTFHKNGNRILKLRVFSRNSIYKCLASNEAFRFHELNSLNPIDGIKLFIENLDYCINKFISLQKQNKSCNKIIHYSLKKLYNKLKRAYRKYKFNPSSSSLAKYRYIDKRYKTYLIVRQNSLEKSLLQV